MSMVALGRRYGVDATIFVVALAARLLVPVFGGGFRGFVGSDQAVYYAGSMAVSHGLVPYSGFSFVHPPVSLVALQPAAWIGRLTTDHAGFIAGNVLFAVLGAISAVLVARVARAAGAGVGAQLAGGLFYAVWMGSVGAEFSSRLEPLGNVVFVAGLLLLTRVRALEEQAPTNRAARLTLLAGAVLGLSVSVKIWWAAPVVFVFLWEYGRSRDARRLGRLVLGAAVASVVVNGPLFLASRGRMWDYVIEAQLGRPRRHPELWYRLGTMTGVKDSLANDVLAGVAVAVVGVVLVACVVVALASPGFREMACLFVFLACPAAVEPVVLPPLRRLPGGAGGADGRRRRSRSAPYGGCAEDAARTALPGPGVRVRRPGGVPGPDPPGAGPPARRTHPRPGGSPGGRRRPTAASRPTCR